MLRAHKQAQPAFLWITQVETSARVLALERPPRVRNNSSRKSNPSCQVFHNIGTAKPPLIFGQAINGHAVHTRIGKWVSTLNSQGWNVCGRGIAISRGNTPPLIFRAI